MSESDPEADIAIMHRASSCLQTEPLTGLRELGPQSDISSAFGRRNNLARYALGVCVA
jgi:hypothetical protein